MQSLDLTSGQQLERSASISTSFSTYRKDNYDENFAPRRNSMKMTILACIYECIVEFTILCMYFDMFLLTTHVFILSLYV